MHMYVFRRQNTCTEVLNFLIEAEDGLYGFVGWLRDSEITYSIMGGINVFSNIEWIQYTFVNFSLHWNCLYIIILGWWNASSLILDQHNTHLLIFLCTELSLH